MNYKTLKIREKVNEHIDLKRVQLGKKINKYLNK